jgi:Fe-S cluster biogenesis protein NfuA
MHTEAKRQIHLYTEASPNPNSLKFVVNFMITPEGKDFNYTSPKQAGQSPLAQGLFEKFYWIEQVFFMNNFLTLTKKTEEEWYELIAEVKPFLVQYFEEKKPIFVFNSEAEMVSATESVQGETDTERQIIQLLDEYVRPAVEGDGGAITFRSFTEGVVNLELRGSCSGCPSSTVTLKQGIQNLLTRMVPEVKEVVAVNM